MPDQRNPFEGVTDFFSEMTRMRSVGLHGETVQGGGEQTGRTHASAWVPATDILAVGNDLVIRVELAGVDPDDVDLRLTHGVLTISGTRRPGELDESAEFYVRERFYGAFRRAITLPEGTTEDKITAEFEDGLVQVTVRGGSTTSDSGRIAVRPGSRRAPSRGVRGTDG